MVKFFDDGRGGSEGPCKRIMETEGEYIKQMVSKTQETGNEYIANIVDITGNTGHTEMIKGTETSILSRQSAESMMDALQLASSIKDTPGGTIKVDFDRHQVHTHPDGFTGLSESDMKSFIDDIVSGGDYPDSELVATQTDGGVILGGVYIQEELTEDDVAELQSSLSMVNAENIPMSLSEEKMELMSAFERTNIGFCSIEW